MANQEQVPIVKRVFVEDRADRPVVVAVCVSSGGIPKIPQPSVQVTRIGFVGDFQAHDKHRKPTRALNLFDEELLLQLKAEGYELAPGSIGENILLRHVRVQDLPPQTVLQLGEVQLRLEEPRKPCFVLDAIDERLKDAIVGRCGYMASVLTEGELSPGTPVTRDDSTRF